MGQSMTSHLWTSNSEDRRYADLYLVGMTPSLCHCSDLANIAARLGGRRLVFDAKTETIVNDAEAKALVTREYRKPYTISEV